MNAHNVLRGVGLAGSASYRNAVATIIADIQRDGGLDLIDIAEAIDTSVGTISNAANKKTDLSAVYLVRLAQHYGAGYLNPCLGMANAQAAPLDNTLTSDILPMVMAVAHKIACARDKDGPGGTTEVPQEKRGYLPDLKKLNQRTGCLIQEIETVA
jgi:transcriptional regulator with XRE-family HTH domain